MTSYIPSEDVSYRIINNFTYHSPFGDQAIRYVEIRDQARALADTLVSLCPTSRELSLAITRLEEVVMWANSAIARNEVPATE